MLNGLNTTFQSTIDAFVEKALGAYFAMNGKADKPLIPYRILFKISSINSADEMLARLPNFFDECIEAYIGDNWYTQLRGPDLATIPHVEVRRDQTTWQNVRYDIARTKGIVKDELLGQPHKAILSALVLKLQDVLSAHLNNPANPNMQDLAEIHIATKALLEAICRKMNISPELES